MATKNAYNIDELSKMTSAELIKLHEVIVEVIKMKRDLESRVKSTEFEVGDIVIVNTPKFKGRKFKIDKLNPKKAVVIDTENKFISYNVPYTMIEISK